jgi:hypothetical protein
MLVSAGATKQFEESRRSQTSLRFSDIYPADEEQLYPEDKLGCARGVLWSLIFEVALVVAALVCWKLRFAR